MALILLKFVRMLISTNFQPRMKTSDKSLVVSIKIIPCAKWKVQWASRVSFKSNWMDISIEALFISCHTLQWGVDIKNAKNAPDSVTCLAAPHPPYRKTQCPALAGQIISYLSWKRVLVQVRVTTFCLSVAVSFIWCCVRLLCSDPSLLAASPWQSHLKFGKTLCFARDQKGS